MRRFCLLFSFLALIATGIGTYFWPNEGLFWLASSDMSAQIIRGLLAVVILVQLFTEPPRHLLLRLMTGGVAIWTAWWAYCTSTMVLTPIFDSILYLQTAIALAITTFELSPADPEIISEKPLASS